MNPYDGPATPLGPLGPLGPLEVCQLNFRISEEISYDGPAGPLGPLEG